MRTIFHFFLIMMLSFKEMWFYLVSPSLALCADTEKHFTIGDAFVQSPDLARYKF